MCARWSRNLKMSFFYSKCMLKKNALKIKTWNIPQKSKKKKKKLIVNLKRNCADQQVHSPHFFVKKHKIKTESLKVDAAAG